jgi:hypothetical protein
MGVSKIARPADNTKHGLIFFASSPAQRHHLFSFSLRQNYGNQHLQPSAKTSQYAVRHGFKIGTIMLHCGPAKPPFLKVCNSQQLQ